jgi:hypothetical protein
MAVRVGETGAKRKGQGSFYLLSHSMLMACLIISVAINFMNSFTRIGAVTKNDGLDLAINLPTVVQESSSARQKTIPLAELTNSAASAKVECHAPLVPLHDRIVDQSSFDSQKIPRLIHVAHISRCLPPDFVVMAQTWKDHFPSYSYFFHGDEAVDRLLKQDWPEFPQLAKIMNTCVKFGGAIKIDIWRVLVLYKYGGIYCDADTAPGVKLFEDAIQSNDSAFFLSDAWNRPSQWMQAMEPKHPIAYFTMLEILTRVLALEDISSIKPVFLTGPAALRSGYEKAFNRTLVKGEDDIFSLGVHDGKFSKQVRKLKGDKTDHVSHYMSEKVAWGATHKTTRKERSMRQLNITHWKIMIEKKKAEVAGGPCWDHLYKADLKNSDEAA